eukprot:CAMPEP_0184484462 /NCGR_PEP_ID=MMETSP0113_2-20130426/6179_1 /TAXON_ID=91329 /ORGANISM="Norrisiella sphaerica, Strain BC52" /LENGTH=306 /DNA_ID=CAMNT_0026865463 /DNA_START=45 /DNA_END=965 /DNA_ORIENTATION=-
MADALNDRDWKRIREVLAAFQKTHVKNRRFHLRQYKDVFVGSELVDYLMLKCSISQPVTRPVAIEIGSKLFAKGIFFHVEGKHEFEDRYLFYQFSSCPLKPNPSPRPRSEASKTLPIGHGVRRRVSAFRSRAASTPIQHKRVQSPSSSTPSKRPTKPHIEHSQEMKAYLPAKGSSRPPCKLLKAPAMSDRTHSSEIEGREERETTPPPARKKTGVNGEHQKPRRQAKPRLLALGLVVLVVTTLVGSVAYQEYSRVVAENTELKVELNNIRNGLRMTEKGMCNCGEEFGKPTPISLPCPHDGASLEA